MTQRGLMTKKHDKMKFEKRGNVLHKSIKPCTTKALKIKFLKWLQGSLQVYCVQKLVSKCKQKIVKTK